jgi:hypothetical protein
MGWRVGEAMRRCADPDLLSAWFVDRRASRAGGRRRRPLFRSEYVDGYEAVQHNQSEAASMKILFRRNRSYEDLESSLVEHLLAGRIVAWGRRETPTASPIAIPAFAWKHLHISDARKSVVREKTKAETKIFDLRIFPIIESPDAVDRLEDKTFVDAFQLSVVDDPQLKALRKRAIAVGGTPASFGNEWPPYRAVWPVVLGHGPNIELAGESDEPTPVKAANHVQRQRFARLISYLSPELLVAEGFPAAGGMTVSISRSIWEKVGTYINLGNGDLLVASPKAKDRLICPLKPLFTGLVLRKAGPVHRISDVPLSGLHRVATSIVGKSKENIVSTMASEMACLNWLLALMRSSPNIRPEIKDFYWRKAHRKWPKSLSNRGFDRAWARSVAEAPAPVWIAGGAPKKPLQSKPPHQ